MSSHFPPTKRSKSVVQRVLGLPLLRPVPPGGVHDTSNEDHRSSSWRASFPAKRHLRRRYSEVHSVMPWRLANSSAAWADLWMYSTHVSWQFWRCNQKMYLSILLCCTFKLPSIWPVRAQAAHPYSNVGVMMASKSLHRSSTG